MKVLPDTIQSISIAMRTLRVGGIVIHPTETCYGIACDLTNFDAVKKLFAIKQRPLDQPVSALFASIEQAKEYVEWNETADKLAKKYLPGPLTIILPLRSDASHKLFPVAEGEAKTIGVRISSHPFAQALVEKFGKPLSTTSANVHGQPNPYSLEDIDAQFSRAAGQPDLILDGGILPMARPSTVIAIEEGRIITVRVGSVRTKHFN